MSEKDLFLNEKPVMALVTIRRSRDEIYGSVISKKIDTTYAHTVKILSELEDQGIVETEKKGRKKILHLTEKGEKEADKFIELLNLLEEDEKNLNPL
jgi:DNA-binding MarR family transcriptional regulator